MSIQIDKTPYPFHVLIKPAGPSCNLRCEYCFYLEKNNLFNAPDGSYFKMDDSTLERLLEQIILSQPEGSGDIAIGWQGGEPTLCGIDFFRRAVEIQKRICPDGIKIINSFQTNGILVDEEWTAFFKENDFLIGLSIDGPARYHDKFRKDAAGKGTFDKVARTLELLLGSGVDVNTLTCVQSDNAGHAAEIYNFLKNAGSEYMQFIPIVEPTGNPRKPVTNRSVSSAQWGKFLTSIFKLWIKEDIGRIFIQHFDSFLGGYAGEPGGLCVYNPICGRSLAAEHNGNIYSCDHFVTPETQIGNISENSLGSMVTSPQQEGFGRAKFDDLPAYCRNCKYLNLCYGECPRNRLLEARGGDGKLNHLCGGFKNFFEYTEPYFRAMAAALSRHLPASEYAQFMNQ